jgi:adenine-specific DNA-methyltransferase
MLKQKYSREDFLEFQKQFLPDFKKDIRRVSSDGLKVTDNVVLLGQSEQLDLHIFEFTHKSTADARVSLAADGFKIMKDHAISQALAVYQSESSNDWRLSLMTATLAINQKGRVAQTFSNPRRYSFFLGPEARIHTPEEFLIKKGKVKDAQDLVSRFDVEIVTKEFFQRYKTLFENLQKFLIGDHAFTVFAKKNDIDVDAFAKKVLGQIVFCYFLQKKGWLGASKGEDIHRGDKNFMRSFFDRSVAKKENFYNEYLEPLFYDSLNAAPEEAGDFYRSYFGCQIPFLNGGLFEPMENYDWKKSFLHIPDTLFSNKKETGILDVFDLYNFTVYEDDPVDREVSVDPEMLGKVFENLLPENIRKGQGAFYTPREIVHYMCQESLINYLVTEAGIEGKNIRKLVTSKEHLFANSEGFVFSPIEAGKLDKALTDIKICDPACGSGAFLVGMLHEIVMARRILNPKQHEYRIKKEAIQNSIYGVDIDPGAVEIAKLRLWLSLVVDYELEDIEPLPNLDYKIMCGNSLLEELIVGDEAIKLFDERLLYVGKKKTKPMLFDETGLDSSGESSRNEELQKLLQKRQREMLDLNNQGKLTPEIKRKLDRESAEILKELAPKKKTKAPDYSVGLFTEKAEEYFSQLRELHKKYFTESNSDMKKRIRKQIEQIEFEFIRSSVQEKIDSIEMRVKNLNLSIPSDRKKNEELAKRKLCYSAAPDMVKGSKAKPYFLWKLNFFEIFQKKGGFDVVIANPPYGADIAPEIKKYIETKYLIAKGNANSAILFIEKGLELTARDHTITYVIPKSFAYSDTWNGARAFLNKNLAILLDIGKGFENVLLEQVVFVAQKDQNFSELFTAKMLPEGELARPFKLSKTECELFGIYPTGLSEDEINLGKKIIHPREFFSDVCEIKRGLDIQQFLTQKKWDVPVYRCKSVGRYILKPAVEGVEKKAITKLQGKIQYMLRPKIVIQNIVAHVANPAEHIILMATLDNEGIISLGSVGNLFTQQNCSPQYLVALFNSKLLSWYAYRFIYGNAIRTMRFDNYHLSKMPLREGKNLNAQKPFIELVDKILHLTRSNNYLSSEVKRKEVAEYIRRIDQLVYKLYGLTQGEIEVVEASC